MNSFGIYLFVSGIMKQPNSLYISNVYTFHFEIKWHRILVEIKSQKKIILFELIVNQIIEEIITTEIYRVFYNKNNMS